MVDQRSLPISQKDLQQNTRNTDDLTEIRLVILDYILASNGNTIVDQFPHPPNVKGSGLVASREKITKS